MIIQKKFTMFKMQLAFVFFFASCQYLPKNSKTKITTTAMENTLMMGQAYRYEKSAQYGRGDIVIFKNSDSAFGINLLVFRIIATNGDVVAIKDGNIFVNNILYRLPSTANYTYKIYDKMELDSVAEALRVSKPGRDSILRFTEGEFQRLASKIVIERSILSSRYDDPIVLRTSESDVRNKHNFGPISIPAINARVSFGKFPTYFFNGLFGDTTKNTIDVKEELYFLIGDDFDDSFDSRYIGLIRKSAIVGRIIVD